MDTSVAFSIFGIDILWYSLVYSIGSLCAYFYFLKYFSVPILDTNYQENINKNKQKQTDKKIHTQIYRELTQEEKDSIFFVTLLISLLFARVFYSLAYFPNYYLSNPLEIVKVWQGGMSINGGFIGFFLSLWYFSKRYRISIYSFTDFFMLPGLLALAFGRLGNFFNQEVYGIPTTSSIGIVFPAVDELSRYPYQLFVGLKNLIVFEIILYLQLFKKLKPGAITLISGILYSSGRFILDFMREPTTLYFGFPLGQWLSLIIFIICSMLLFKLYSK